MSDQHPPSDPTGSTPPNPPDPPPFSPPPPPPDLPAPTPPNPPDPPPFSTPPPPPGQGYGPPPGQGYGPPPGQGYGPPPGQGYGAQPQYGGPAGWTGPQLADWPKRAYSYLIDYLGPAIVASFFYQINSAVGLLAGLAALGWAVYNAYLGGETGQSIGKKQAGTRVLRESDGQLIGGGLGIGRFFLHILDALPCYLGFLWPLWDAKKQTFSDKIVHTVVVDEGVRR